MSRTDLLERYRALALPVRTEEHWRFTDLAGFDPAAFAAVLARPGVYVRGPLAAFASNLSGQVQRTVVDRTGLTGGWDFEITYAAERPANVLFLARNFFSN